MTNSVPRISYGDSIATKQKETKRIDKPGHNSVLFDPQKSQILIFENPLRIISTSSIEDVASILEDASRAAENNRWAVGFVAYEAAAAFDPAYKTREIRDFPLAWFAVYDAPKAVKSLPESSREIKSTNWKASMTAAEYSRAFNDIMTCVQQGETYQVNFTMRLSSDCNEDPFTFFKALVASGQSKYAAFIDIGDQAICSASPELFFRLDGDKISCRPMKGTGHRGNTLRQDFHQADWLHSSEKNRAENVMIVDMMRNDLGRIAETGSVNVSSLFETERYPTVWQMTSPVTAQTRASVPEIFKALFPCSSITGAPKTQTMKIIRRLETSPRKIYTGSIGYIAPGRHSQFNVAIRTVLIDKKNKSTEYGTGGGLVYDSICEDEYNECLLKARVLTGSAPDFSLLETLLWEPGKGYFLLNYHLRRMKESAFYFDFPDSSRNALAQLRVVEAELPKTRNPHRIRLLADLTGNIKIERFPFVATNQLVSLKTASKAVDSKNIFLYHKTTNREIYETAKVGINADDVILFNEKYEITETTIGNLMVEFEDGLFTPPISCGLLAGTYREWLLDQGKIKEKNITLEELKKAKNVYRINSLRGLQQCKWID